MPRRPKLEDVPSGNPFLRRLTNAEGRLNDHETRITSTEAELRELNLDIAILGDMVVSASELALRARRRAAARVIGPTRRRRRPQ